VPVGQAGAFGGDVLIRSEALAAVGGYRDDLIAGEEPELCIRLRRQGWKIFRIDHPMTFHDAAITNFAQWWMRSRRSGYAFAQGSDIHGDGPERHWVWETRRSVIWAGLLPLSCLALTIALFPWGLVTWSIFPLRILTRSAQRRRDRHSLKLALFESLSRFPEAQGAFQFWIDKLRKSKRNLIEYK
jgi:GT2 family glycosyltransferase